MKVITYAYDTLIIAAIKKYANEAEHNHSCYVFNIEKNERPLCISYGDDFCVLGKFDKSGEYSVFSGILADNNENMLKGLILFLEYAFSHSAKKVSVEFTTNFREYVIKNLGKRYRCIKPKYFLIWPVFDISKWDGDLMRGSQWKDMRYYWNRFFREHEVEFKDFIYSDKNKYLQLVNDWKDKRTANDRTYTEYYVHAVENGFKGYDIVRIMYVDGEPCAINAGFKMPTKKYYYSSIGIYNKKYDRIGEVSYMDDLINLKKLGYEFVDFGGSEQNGIDFKKKFKPTYYYKSYLFSIVKRSP